MTDTERWCKLMDALACSPDFPLDDVLTKIHRRDAELIQLRQDKADLLEALEALMGTCCHRVEWERKWPNIVKKCKAAIAKTKARP